MCGLIGFSGKKSYDYKHIRFLLFWNSIERGIHATGVYTPKTGIVKDNISAKSFITNKKLISKIELDNNFIGHVRAATVGGNVPRNAHPFEYGDVVVAHNGTLQSYYELVRMYQLNYNDYEVDSQVLAKCISINTKYDEKIRVLEQYEGAAALLWFNKAEDALYAYHDKERPLFYGYINKTEMYISSIQESLEAINCEDIKAFDTSVLYKIVDGKIVSTESYKTKIKNSLIEIICASKTDLELNKKKKKTWYTSKRPNISGIDANAFEPEHAKGFWIMCDSHGIPNQNNVLNKKHELLKANHWYYVLGKANEGDYSHTTSYMELQNTEEETGIMASGIKFNTREFIPQENKYVISMVDIYFTNSKVTLCKEGDFLFVKEYTYGDSEILLVNPYNKLSGTCPLSLIRVARKEETKKYLAKLDACQIDFTKTKATTKDDEDDTDDLPFKEDAKNLLPEKTSIEKKYPEISFSYGTVCNLISKILEDIIVVEDKLEINQVNSALLYLKSLQDDLILLYDPDFFEVLTPEEEKEKHTDHYDLLK